MGIGVFRHGRDIAGGTIGRLAPPKAAQRHRPRSMAAGWRVSSRARDASALETARGGSISWLWRSSRAHPLAWPIGAKPAPLAEGVRIQSVTEALGEAMRHRSYWLLTAGFFVCGCHVAFSMVHLRGFTVDQGLPSWVGPYALSAVGIANIIGTYLAGQSGRYIDKRKALSVIYFGRAVLFFGFLFLPITPATVIITCALLGLLWLATIPLTSGLVATFFGTTWMSMLFGIVFLSHQIGAFLGVWLGGRIFDMTQSYDLMWWISIGLGVYRALNCDHEIPVPAAACRNRKAEDRPITSDAFLMPAPAAPLPVTPFWPRVLPPHPLRRRIDAMLASLWSPSRRPLIRPALRPAPPPWRWCFHGDEAADSVGGAPWRLRVVCDLRAIGRRRFAAQALPCMVT